MAMKKRASIAALGFFLASVGWGQTLARVTEWSLPTAGSRPAFIVSDDAGGFYFTERDTARLGHFDPATGVLQEWIDPSPFFNFGLAMDSAGDVWFAAHSRNLVRFDPQTSRFETFDLPVSATPFMVDATGLVCVTEFFRNSIGCLDPATAILTEWPIPTAFAAPESIVAAPDGTLIFGQSGGRKIARLDPISGTITEWHLPVNGALRLQIAVTSDGNVWFPQIEASRLTRLDPDRNEIVEYITPQPDQPFAVAFDTLGHVWFNGRDDSTVNILGRLDPDRESGTVMTVTPSVTTVSPIVSLRTVVDHGVEAPITTVLEEVVSEVVSIDSGGFKEWFLPSMQPGPGGLFVDERLVVFSLEHFADKIVRLEVGPVGLVDELETEVAEAAALLVGVPGAPGLINKLDQMSRTVRRAAERLAAGLLGASAYLVEIAKAVSTLEAFENQLEAKIGNGQISEPAATDLRDGVQRLRTLLTALASSA